MQGAVFTVMVVRVSDPDDPAFEEGLAQQISRNPRFFENAPVVLDIKGVTGLNNPDEFERLKAVLRRQKLVAAGIQNGTTSQRQGALDAGLGTFIASQPRSLRETLGHNGVVADAPAAAAPSPQPAPAAPADGARGDRTRLVTQPVRSGTQIYARGTDLIITASVSPGAEVIADGNIHVYGSLRGRAIAGASGDTEARIFANRLEAELVSVAGHYLVSESIDRTLRDHPVQVSLVDDRLTIIRN